MAPSAPQPTAVRFSDFLLDLETGELHRNGQHIQLQPKALEVLAALVERPGEVVTREQLRAKLWTRDTFVEFDDSLNHAVKRLRETLDDSADHPRFIETLPRHGYRFIAEVRAMEPARAKDETIKRFLVQRKWATLGALLLVAISGYLLWSYRARAHNSGQRVTLAVLPLDNLTGSEEQVYLSDGFTEEIITELGRMNPERLGVIARTSTLRYKQTKQTVAEIGHELGVDYIIEGGLLQVSPQLRMTVQLIRVSDQTHLWAQAYDLPSNDIGPVQQDVAERIARALAIESSPASRRRLASTRPVNPEAREAYLRGRYWLTRGTGSAMSKAQEYFTKAAELDPGYAEAYAGLAMSYLFLGNYQVISPNEARPKAKAAALKALKLDDSAVEARLVLAGIKMEHEWDFAGALQDFQIAVWRDPNSAMAHQWYSALLAALGRFDEAISESKTAYELDPLSFRVGVDLGRSYYFARHYDLAIQQYRKVLELDPDYSGAHSMLGLALLEKRDFGPAIMELEKGLALLPGNTGYSIWLGYAYAVVGRRPDAQKMLAKQVEYHAQKHSAAGAIALTYLGMGNKDQALAWLETAYNERDNVTMLKAYPFWDALRSEPRFQDLLRRIGLPQ